jgi:hypothetical protein
VNVYELNQRECRLLKEQQYSDDQLRGMGFDAATIDKTIVCTGSSARKSEGTNMNRQARLEGAKEWNSYGKVSFFEALKAEAIATAEKSGIFGIWIVECRCESDPAVIDTFSVQVTLHAEILNPRNGDL